MRAINNFLQFIGVTSDEIATLKNCESEIQTQIDLKAPLASPSFLGTLIQFLTGSELVGDRFGLSIESRGIVNHFIFGDIDSSGEGYKLDFNADTGVMNLMSGDFLIGNSMTSVQNTGGVISITATKIDNSAELCTFGSTSLLELYSPNNTSFIFREKTTNNPVLSLDLSDALHKKIILGSKDREIHLGDYLQQGNTTTLSIIDSLSSLLLQAFGPIVLGDVSGANNHTTLTIDDINSVIKLATLPTYADNAAAASLPLNALYKTATGQVMIKY